MPAYLLKIAYNGKNYHGLIPQENVKTILGEIFSSLNLENVKYNVVSRTDKGVSALENYVVIKTKNEIEIRDNKELIINNEIFIKKIYELKEFINIRKFSRGKIYNYKLPKTLFDEKYIYRPKYIVIDNYKIEIKWKDEEFSIKRYIEGAKKFVGKHNFENFAKGRVKNSYCTIWRFDVIEKEDYWENIIEGNRFLYEMIRKIISFLVSVGKNRFPIDKIDIVLSEGKLDPKPPSAPPEYLLLEKVYLDWIKLSKYIKRIII